LDGFPFRLKIKGYFYPYDLIPFPPTASGPGLRHILFLTNSHAPLGAGTTKNEKGFKGPRGQVKGVEVKTLEPSNPGILEPYFRTKPTCAL
jgi:hypothetical protein